MRNRLAETAMLREIHLRNLIAKYQEFNRKEYAVAAIPQVGLFWLSLDGRSFHKSAVSIRDAVDYGDFRICEASHHDEWANAVRANPRWSGKEYEDVPRGRVVLSMLPRRDRFVVYLPHELKRHQKKIARAFSLPPSSTVYDETDEHYGRRRES